MQRPGAIEWHADDAGLLRQGLQNGLTNPPDRVRDELDALRLIELVSSPDESEVALVDEIGERDALILVLLRDGHDEAKIGAHELIERLLIIHADALREPHLFVAGDQRINADVAEVLVERPF